MEPKLPILIANTLSSPAPSLSSRHLLPQLGPPKPSPSPPAHPYVQPIPSQLSGHQALAHTDSLPSAASRCTPPSRSHYWVIQGAACELRLKGGEGVHHRKSWGGACWEEGTASAKALRLECVCVLEEQQGGQCGWSRVEGRGESEGRRVTEGLDWGGGLLDHHGEFELHLRAMKDPQRVS